MASLTNEEATFAPGFESRKDAVAERARREYLLERRRRIQAKLRQLKLEALALAVPLAHAEAFHASRKQVRILDGSNQSAKTFHANLEIGRALCGRDDKYPKRNGRAVFVGYDGDHLADPLYRKLFEPGEFKLVRDEMSREWRAVRPDPKNPRQLDPYDWAYRETWKDADPIIPPRMVAKMAWEEAGKKVPRVTKLTTGWEILWRSSGSRPPRGRQIDLAFADEDLQNPQAWVPELIPRLIKRGGKFIWAATGQEGGLELYELRQKAEADSPYVDAFKMLVEENPFISDEQRAFFYDTLLTEDERAVRYYGEDLIGLKRVYPLYDPNGPHGCEPFAIPTQSWARYVFLDPGRQRAATILLAIDPEERHRWVYDGFLLRHADATTWAQEIKKRQGDMRFEAFVIDKRMGKETPVSQLKNVARQYFEALLHAGVQPRQRGTLEGFVPGLDDIPAREEALLHWMIIRGDGPFAGTPLLQVMRGVIPELDREIRLAQTKANGKRADHVPQDLVTALEYGAASQPGYHRPEPLRPPPPKPSPHDVYEAFQEKQRRQARRNHLYRTGIY